MAIRPLIAGNWKMYGNLRLVQQFSQLARELPSNADAEITLFPPTLLLERAVNTMGDSWSLGGQDCHWQQEGAYTGETSPNLLREIGCQYILIGHSERRHQMGETDEYVHDKILAAFAANLVPVLCIGETHEQHRAQETYITLASQLYHGLPKNALDHEIIIAYEPVWAIGTGLTPTLEDVQNCHDHIRTFLCTHWHTEKAETTRLLYGGSVNADNARDFLQFQDVNGLLIGGASLKPETFKSIIQQTGS